jgi:hypothetical protein
MTFRPPVVTRIWPRNPAGAAVNSQAGVSSNNALILVGQDKFFGAGGPTYDYPNPRAAARASDLRTWVESVNLNLLGQDKFFGAGGPTYDYPNPRAPGRSIDLRTWVWSTPFGYFPQPFFGLAGHPNYDWPNPRAPARSIDLRTWAWALSLLLPTAEETAVANYDQPNPRGYRYPTDLRTWINQGNIQLGRVIGIPTLAFSSDQATAASTAGVVSVFTCTASDSPSGQNWRGSGFMAKYEIDTSIQIEGVFLNALSNVYIDPSEVQLFIMDPDGNVTDYTTLNGGVTRQQVGYYTVTIVPGISGTWTYKWQGTGVAPATSPDTTLVVNSSVLI